ncbi:unnamed protein product, partial [Mesorhabditis spiculigera]
MQCRLDARAVQSEPSLGSSPLVPPFTRIIPGTLVMIGSAVGLEYMTDGPVLDIKVEMMSVDETQMDVSVAQDNYMEVDGVDNVTVQFGQVVLDHRNYDVYHHDYNNNNHYRHDDH